MIMKGMTMTIMIHIIRNIIVKNVIVMTTITTMTTLVSIKSLVKGMEWKRWGIAHMYLISGHSELNLYYPLPATSTDNIASLHQNI